LCIILPGGRRCLHNRGRLHLPRALPARRPQPAHDAQEHVGQALQRSHSPAGCLSDVAAGEMAGRRGRVRTVRAQVSEYADDAHDVRGA